MWVMSERSTELNMTPLAQALGEHLLAYTLVGYTHNGERVFMSQAHSQLERDGVLHLLEETVSGEFPYGS